MSGMRVREIAAGVRQLTFESVMSMHVYLIDTDGGVVAFDAAVSGVGKHIQEVAGATLAELILSHSHVDHRGAAPELAAPIYCHPAEVGDAEGDGGRHYIDWSLVSNPAVREGLPRLHDTWDGGPVEIAATVDEGTDVGGFRVVHLPGHAPGLIGLYRDADGVALASDMVYTFDAETGEGGVPRVPHPAFNWDTDTARASIKKLRDLRPAVVWTGHGNHLSGDVVAQLDLAAAWDYPQRV